MAIGHDVSMSKRGNAGPVFISAEGRLHTSLVH